MSGNPGSGGGFDETRPGYEALAAVADEEFCYLTTTGRVTGLPHEIEIWFALISGERTLYLLSGGRDRSDWVKNLKKEARVIIRISSETIIGTARFIEGEREDPTARDLLVEKYERNPGGLAEWRRDSLPVAIDLA
ncbi:MAG: nitroreductase/quinone reductase family protein [Rubrobacter sp.]